MRRRRKARGGGKGKRSERARIKERGRTDQWRAQERAGENLGMGRETGVWSGGVRGGHATGTLCLDWKARAGSD